jgi:hypothetical protein
VAFFAPSQAVDAGRSPPHDGHQLCPESGGAVSKIDLKKGLKRLYRHSAKEVVQLEVPELKYLMVDGEW